VVATYCDEGWQDAKWNRVQLTLTYSRNFEISGCLLICISFSKTEATALLPPSWNLEMSGASSAIQVSLYEFHSVREASEIKQLNMKLIPLQLICNSILLFPVAFSACCSVLPAFHNNYRWCMWYNNELTLDCLIKFGAEKVQGLNKKFETHKDRYLKHTGLLEEPVQAAELSLITQRLVSTQAALLRWEGFTILPVAAGSAAHAWMNPCLSGDHREVSLFVFCSHWDPRSGLVKSWETMTIRKGQHP